jgi:hypothetical protein
MFLVEVVDINKPLKNIRIPSLDLNKQIDATIHNTSLILSCLIDARCVKVHVFCNGMYPKVEEKGTSTNVQGKSKDHYVFMANTLVVALTLLTLLRKFTFNLVGV